MLKKLIVVAAGLIVSAPVLAGHGHDKHYWKRHHPHSYYHPRPVVVMPPPHVYYAPAPVYVAPPAPVYYAPPQPVYPRSPSGVSIRLHFPL
jgi:hypothetical protein